MLTVLDSISHQHDLSPQDPTATLNNKEKALLMMSATLWNASYYNACIVALVSQAAYKAQVWAQLVFV
jgi:hypothetical protein